MLQTVADLDKTEYGIKDLTIKLAESAGYVRKLYKFKNGSIRERTMYTGKFDNVLTAKWLCHYKKLFIAKLSVHPEFSEHHTYIIDRVFYIVMTSLNLSKIVTDNVINKYVNAALASRIAEIMWDMGSIRRLEDFNAGGERKFKLKSVANYTALSVDQMVEDGAHDELFISKQLDINDDFLIDLKHKLANNKYGLKLLYSMLYSDKRIQLSHIDDFVQLDTYEKTDLTKQELLDAYNIIVVSLKDYVDDPSKYRWKKAKTIHYANEERGYV